MLDHRDPCLVEQVTEAAPTGVDAVRETSGRHDFELVQRTGAPGARVLVSAAASRQASVPWPDLCTRGVRVLGFVISRASVADLAAAASLINCLHSRGVLTARIAEVLPPARTAHAHQRLESGGVSGCLVLRP